MSHDLDKLLRIPLFFVLDADRQPVAVPILEWSRVMETNYANPDATAWQVALHTLAGCTVSTVFTGVNLNYLFGPPLVFETMVFGGPLDGLQLRYSSWEEAEAGHAQTVVQVQAHNANPVVKGDPHE